MEEVVAASTILAVPLASMEGGLKYAEMPLRIRAEVGMISGLLWSEFSWCHPCTGAEKYPKATCAPHGKSIPTYRKTGS